MWVGRLVSYVNHLLDTIVVVSTYVTTVPVMVVLVSVNVLGLLGLAHELGTQEPTLCCQGLFR